MEQNGTKVMKVYVIGEKGEKIEQNGTKVTKVYVIGEKGGK